MAITRYEPPAGPPETASQNVKNYYKGWSAAEVQADLAPKRSAAVQVFMNLTHDFNKAAAIRSHNCFLGKEVYMVGHRRYDKRGTVGTHHYETVFHADTFQEVTEHLRRQGYTLFAVENAMEWRPVNLWQAELPELSAFVYGEEGLGLSEEVLKSCDERLFIASEGSCRSLNVAVASAVVLGEYTRRRAMGL